MTPSLRMSFLILSLMPTTGQAEGDPEFTLADPASTRCLAQAVYFEARSEPLEGQIAVAQVILNRVNSPDWPNDICSVVFQNHERRNRCQFSFACDGKSDIPRDMATYKRILVMSKMVIEGRLPMMVDDLTWYYHADYVNPRWSDDYELVKTYGRHLFYSGASR